VTKKTNGQTVLELLELYSPAFQLKSGTEELKSSELFLSQVARRTDHISRASHACSLSVLKYLADSVKDEYITLETGGGWSTCVFAACAKKHICINPDITANELIERFLREHDVNIGELVFHHETSDMALPALDKTCHLDVAFIDGNHSFPIPVLDWHYIDLHLKEGGVILIDDSHIRSVGVLSEYLSKEESYEKITTIGQTEVFRKVAEHRVWGWADQNFNKMNNRGLNHHASGLWGRFFRHINRILRST
jgi:predicted O-methyltransferase YrrM